MEVTGRTKSFTEKYIFEVVEDNKGDYVYKRSVYLRHGVTLWSRGDVYWVVKYSAFLTISFIVLVLVFIDHVLNLGRIVLTTKMLDYVYPIGAILYALPFYIYEDKIGSVSMILDKCTEYPYLEKLQKELKRRAEEKTNKFHYIYFNFMKFGCIFYCMMPILRNYLSATTEANALLFPSWSPFPLTTWIGFSIIYLLELLTLLTVFITFGSIISYLITVVVMVGYQCQLMSTSLVTINERTSRIMEKMGVQKGGSNWLEIHTRTIHDELRKIVNHFQRIRGLTTDTCAFFTISISMCSYVGIFVLAMCCEKLATARFNKSVLFQVSYLGMAVFLNQFLIAFVNQIITNQIEDLQFAVYNSPWYTFRVSCRKMVHILQSMMLKKPTIKTILGTRADMEFFMNIVYATYCCLSALLSMKVNY